MLEQRTNKLKEVIVEAEKPLRIKGDTLSYAVGQWKDKKDVSIEDVLKRIPGIEVDDDGYIKHNGNSINHLYINGIDLLENRYTIATKGLPAGVIKNVEVLQQHSHKQINRNTGKSKGVSINLETKDKSILTGIVTTQLANPVLSGGFDATPIVINPKSQLIGSLKGANFGNDYIFNDRSINVLTLGKPEPELDFIEIFQFYNKQRSNLKQQYWRDTYTGNTSLDYLTTKKKNELFKLGYSTDFDQVQIDNSFEEVIQLGDENITNNQFNDITSITRNHYLKGYYERNKLESYLKIDVYAQSFHKDQYANTLLNGVNFKRRLENLGTTIYSSIQFDKKTSLGLLSMDAGAQIKDTDGELFIDRTVFDILQTGSSNGTFQDIDTQENIYELKVGLYNDIKNGSLEFQLQGSYRKQKLSSDFGLVNDNSYDVFPFDNLQKYKRNKLNLKARLNQTWGKLRLSVTSDIYYNDILNKDISQSKESINGVYIEPSAYLNYSASSKWSFGMSTSLENTFSNINQTPTSFLITDYNSSSRFENRIQETRNYNISFNTRYKDILNGFFFNIDTNYNVNENKLISSLSFDEQGFRVNSFRDLVNSNSSVSISTNFSKTVGKSINIKLELSYNQFLNDIFINDELIKLDSRGYNSSLRISYDPLGWYYIIAKMDFYNSQSQTSNNTLNSYSFDTNIVFGQEWNENHFTEVTWNGQRNTFLENDNYNNLFDFRYVWKLKSDRELNFKILNLGNQKRFTSINNSSNITSINSFPLLGRQIILSYQFFF